MFYNFYYIVCFNIAEMLYWPITIQDWRYLYYKINYIEMQLFAIIVLILIMLLVDDTGYLTLI